MNKANSEKRKGDSWKRDQVQMISFDLQVQACPKPYHILDFPIL